MDLLSREWSINFIKKCEGERRESDNVCVCVCMCVCVCVCVFDINKLMTKDVQSLPSFFIAARVTLQTTRTPKKVIFYLSLSLSFSLFLSLSLNIYISFSPPPPPTHTHTQTHNSQSVTQTHLLHFEIFLKVFAFIKHCDLNQNNLKLHF
jgi:hypothetical protein